ncbi:MAG: thioredoxin family protein [Candidatus Omnitrophota bacterium]
MSLITAINDEQFKEKVLNSPHPVLLDINSPECIICRTMDERIREVAHQFRGKVRFYSLDVNKNRVWQRYEVKAVPTILYFKDGKLFFRHDVFPEKEEMTAHLKKLVQK